MNRTDNISAMIGGGPHRLVLVRNTEATAVPPFAAMRITGLDTDTGALTIAKPNLNGMADVLFNSPTPIPAGEKGQAVSGLPCIAAYSKENDEGVDPSDGEIWGCLAGSWFLSRMMPGFKVMGAGDGGRVNVRPMTTALAGFVTITSITATSGRYPATEQSYDPEAKAWTTGDTCWVVECNGSGVALVRTPAILMGYANGRRVWSARFGGGTRVRVVTCVALKTA